MTKPKPHPGYYLTDDDLAVLRFLEAHRFATAPQIARWRQTSQQAVWHRFKRLRALGLVESDVVPFTRCHRVHWLTEAAYKRLGSVYAHAVTPTSTRIEHDLACTDLAVTYRLKYPGIEMVTERQISRELYIARRGWRTDPQPGPWMIHHDDQGGTHSPDLILITKEPLDPDDPAAGTRDRFHCTEAELHGKGTVRLKRIMRSMMSDDRVASLTYFTPSTTQRDRLVAIYEGLRTEFPAGRFADDWFLIRKYVPLHSTLFEHPNGRDGQPRKAA